MLRIDKSPAVSRSTTQRCHPAYRPDIDGLRAFAILAVVIFHAFPTLLPGGFVGVDVFFVISGYLISSIIFKNLESGTFSFYDFYSRRVRRIFPALLLVLAATFAFGWITLLATEFQQLNKHIAAGLSFVQNIVLFQESSYFDVSSELKPLTHLWSLGVEEQFYLAFPIIALCIWRWSLNALIIITTILLTSLCFNIVEVSANTSAAFFLPQYRFWELLCGSTLAYIGITRNSDPPTLIISNLASGLGLGILIASIIFINKNLQFPGYWALPPVLGSALIIGAGQKSVINKYIFNNRIAVWIGLISYPLYLWHWPLLTFARIIESEVPSPQTRIVVVLASVGLAWMTYRFVEKPFRAKPNPRLIFNGLIVTAAIVASVAVLTVMNNGFPFRQKDREEFAQSFANTAPDWKYFTNNQTAVRFRMDCDFYDTNSFFKGKATNIPASSIAPSCYTPTSNKKVLLWGDSHVQQLNYGLTHTLPDSVSILQVASSGCSPNLPDNFSTEAEYCRVSNQKALEVIKKVAPEVVLIAQITGHDTVNDYKAMTKLLKSFGVAHVVIAGPVPKYQASLYQIITRKYWLYTPRRIIAEVDRSVFEVDAALKEKYGSGQGGFEYFSMTNLFCNNDGCITYLGNDRKNGLVTFDATHLTSIASVYVAKTALAEVILKDLKMNP
ncbi:acyltransferase family protein [Pseudomonas fluorescens]|uniref:O-antigen acetylase n=1 Tax=Pseudomonas fluorescens TaxID=294 RepID=A0A0F4UJQ2_PSEFL|nr:acyltransferase family protein [Pseudomonas fluorescens]KJZ56983.1 O-antigen acetylase [Pseudomonas fluorescens]